LARKKATTLGQYLSIVSALRKRWSISRYDEIWFRSEDTKHFDTRLQPGIFRPNSAGVKRRSVKSLIELESHFYEEFRRCAPQLSASDAASIEDLWYSYFLMQHYGVPTRLLDWTDGALIALHFAVKGKSTKPTSGSIIYVLDPYWLIDLLDEHPDRADTKDRWSRYVDEEHPADTDKSEWDLLYLPREDEGELRRRLLALPEIPVLWDSPHVTRRIAAQRSRFLIFGRNPDFLTELEHKTGSRLFSIEIPRGSVSRIRVELRDAGISESVVFPDLDGLGRELKQEWDLKR